MDRHLIKLKAKIQNLIHCLQTVHQLKHNTTSNTNKDNTDEMTDKKHMLYNKAVCLKDIVTHKDSK